MFLEETACPKHPTDNDNAPYSEGQITHITHLAVAAAQTTPPPPFLHPPAPVGGWQTPEGKHQAIPRPNSKRLQALQVTMRNVEKRPAPTCPTCPFKWVMSTSFFMFLPTMIVSSCFPHVCTTEGHPIKHKQAQVIKKLKSNIQVIQCCQVGNQTF